MSDAEAELRQLCDKYPTFSLDERAQDEKWLTAEIETGRLQGVPVEKFKGEIVAVFQGEVVKTGTDETAIRIELAKRFTVHPGRFVLRLIGGPAVPKKAAAAGCSIVNVVLVLVLCALVGLAAISAMGTKSNATFSKIGSTVN